MTEKIRVIIVDDHPLVRKGCSALLKLEDSIEIVGEAADGEEAIEKSRDLQPDVVLMDITMPVMDGFEATAKITHHWPDIKVLILSMHDEAEYAQKLRKSGASGYALKSISINALLTAINSVYQGGTYVSPEILPHLINPPPPLTDREIDVLCDIFDGLTDKEIARDLEISVRTVETHKQNIKRKLGIHTTAGLTLYAFKNGICSFKNGLGTFTK